MDAAAAPEASFWVFGYGSLIWSPGFPYLARAKAMAIGWRRRLCIFSHYYRGVPDQPGLVLGLVPGDLCEGVAFRVDETRREPTLAYLRERELISGVYSEEWVEARLETGGVARALTYVAVDTHSQFAPPMPREALLEMVRQGRGSAGANADYVLNTHDHLAALGIIDPELEWLARELRA